MPTNENGSLPNRNTFVAGISGTGKSNVLRQLVAATKCKRVIAWDPDKDHPVKHRVLTMTDLIDYLQLNRSKAAFSVAYSGKVSADLFELFAAAAFEALDGNRPTVVLCEEMADVTNAGKARQNLGTLIRRGRKFGMLFFGISQKPQEVSSTIFDNCAEFYVGRLKRLGAQRVSDETDLPIKAIRALPNLSFYHLTTDYNGEDPADRLKVFKYKAAKNKTPTL